MAPEGEAVGAPPHVINGPGALFLTRTSRAVHAGPAAVAAAVTRSVVLYGWQDARTTLVLLDLVASPAVVRPRAAALHASQVLEPAAPGSAAMCGLARTLLLAPPRPAAVIAEVLDAVRAARHPSRRLSSTVATALGGLLALADAAPDDLAVMAPLFLRAHRLAPGASIELHEGVPALVLAGEVELTPADRAQVVLGGLERSSRSRLDVRPFTAALQTSPPAVRPAEAVAGTPLADSA